MTATRLVRVDQVPLAFGMDWIPVLGEPDFAQAQARREGASHRVLSGNPPAALGLARGLAQRQACWSAADLWARQHPQGTMACCIALDSQTWHVLASHEGVVLARADRGYPDPGLADQALDALRLAYPRLQILHHEADGAALLRDLARQAAIVAPLVRVGRRRALPLATALVLLAGAGWWGWGGKQAMPVDTGADDRQAWDQALTQVLARRPLHGGPGTQALLHALSAQPARLAGWVLQQTRCQPGSGAGWQCRSEYRRLDPRADNRGLLQAAPTAWQLEFPTLDRAQAVWTLTLTGQPADPVRLPVSRLIARDWASALQAVLPAFTTLRLEAPQALLVPAPQDAQGRALPEPPDMPRLAYRALKVEGPLRSAGLLVPLAHSVSWHQAVLSHAPGARPGLKTSRLILHLEGSLYENRH
ncbi:hypothetical protein [Castellaniella sp.]|uniref:hypothetical protein n=1 Tax=Castellaniella sp. TaxID=1955812 RepID=UPI003C70F133